MRLARKVRDARVAWSNARNNRVAVIPGVGIGLKVTDAPLVVMPVVEERYGDFHLELEYHVGGAAVYARTGEVLSSEILNALRAAAQTQAQMFAELG
jgi:isocitrate/isopropylmalate dehydrogenase